PIAASGRDLAAERDFARGDDRSGARRADGQGWAGAAHGRSHRGRDPAFARTRRLKRALNAHCKQAWAVLPHRAWIGLRSCAKRERKPRITGRRLGMVRVKNPQDFWAGILFIAFGGLALWLGRDYAMGNL